MKKLLLAAAVLFSFSALAVAQPAGAHGERQARRAAPTKQNVSRDAGRRAVAPRRDVGRRAVPLPRDGYRGHYPQDHRGYVGRYNDRFPSDRYYWDSARGRHYHRYYMPYHRWVMCIDGRRYPAGPAVCVANGGVLYFW